MNEKKNSNFILRNINLNFIQIGVLYSAVYASSTVSPYDNEISYGRSLTTVKKTDIGPAHVLRTNTRPPLAGPYAFSRIPKPYWDRPRVHLMNDISDSFLFVNFSSG